MPEKQGGVRRSGLELMRIILMMGIVAHHYVVNSGGVGLLDFTSINASGIFLILWGMWGKTCINAFVMVTGYFMCTRSISLRKFLKLFLEIKFYSITIFVILALAGWQAITGKEIIL